MQKLKRTAPIDHGPIYRGIEADTEALQFPGLQQELLRVVREFWYEELIRKPVLETNGKVTLDKFGLSRSTILPLENIINAMPEGLTKTRIVLWIHSNPGVGIFVHPDLRRYTKKRGVESLAVWFHRTDRNADYVSISTFTVMRPLWEAYKATQQRLPSRLKRKLQNFCQTNLNSELPSTVVKSFCINVLLEQGKSKPEIKNLIKVHNVSNEISDKYVKNKIFSWAKEWREEYPKWQVGNVKTTLPEDFPEDDSENNKGNDGDNKKDSEDRNDPHKNDRGKGHEKGKGRGH